MLQTAGDIEWASTEYWLLRRLLACLVVPANLEVMKVANIGCCCLVKFRKKKDIVMSCATLFERSFDSLPAEAEALVSSFVDMVVKGGDSSAVVRAARNLCKASVRMVPELDGKIASFEETLRSLKTQGGALSRAQILSSIGNNELQKNRNQATVQRIKEQHNGMEESLKLTKVKCFFFFFCFFFFLFFFLRTQFFFFFRLNLNIMVPRELS